MSQHKTLDRSITLTRTTIGGIGALIAASGLVTAVDSLAIGIITGIALLGIWAVSPGIYAFAAGQLLFAVFAPVPSGLLLVAIEGGLLILLVGSRPVSGQVAVVTGSSFVLLAGLVWSLHGLFEGLWPAASGLVVIITLVAYSLHRYELVQLGLVEAEQ